MKEGNLWREGDSHAKEDEISSDSEMAGNVPF